MINPNVHSKGNWMCLNVDLLQKNNCAVAGSEIGLDIHICNEAQWHDQQNATMELLHL